MIYLKVRVLALFSIFFAVLYSIEFSNPHLQPYTNAWAYVCVHALGLGYKQLPVFYIATLFLAGIGSFGFKEWGYRCFTAIVWVNPILFIMHLTVNAVFGLPFELPLFDAGFLKASIPTLLFSAVGAYVFQDKQAKRLFGIKSDADLLCDNGVLLEKGSLEEALFHPNVEVNIAAARKLKEVVDQASIPYLLRALRPDEPTESNINPDETVLSWLTVSGMTALGQQRGSENPKARFRAELLEGISRLSGPTVLTEIVQFLKDPNELVRASAVRALSRRKETACIPYLIESLKDPSVPVRCEVLSALVSLTGQQYVPEVFQEGEQVKAISLYKAWWESQKQKDRD